MWFDIKNRQIFSLILFSFRVFRFRETLFTSLSTLYTLHITLIRLDFISCSWEDYYYGSFYFIFFFFIPYVNYIIISRNKQSKEFFFLRKWLFSGFYENKSPPVCHKVRLVSLTTLRNPCNKTVVYLRIFNPKN